MSNQLSRSYKRWQNGELYEKAREVMKHFFPAGQASTGLNRKSKVQMIKLDDAIEKALSFKKSEADARSILLALKCNLPKEQ